MAAIQSKTVYYSSVIAQLTHDGYGEAAEELKNKLKIQGGIQDVSSGAPTWIMESLKSPPTPPPPPVEEPLLSPLLRTQILFPSRCTAVGASADYQVLLGGASCGTIKIHLESPTSQASMVTHKIGTAPITAAAVNPARPMCFAGNAEGIIEIFKLIPSYGGLPNRIVETGEVRALKGHPCGDFLLAAADDNLIRLYDLTCSKLFMHQTLSHQGPVTGLECSSDGGFYLSSSLDGAIHLWDLRTGADVHKLPQLHGGEAICSVELSKDQNLFLSAGLDGYARLFDMRTLREIQLIGNLDQPALDVQANFFNGDKWVIMAKKGKQIFEGGLQVFNAFTGTQIGVYSTNIFSDLTAASCSDKSILTADLNGTLRVLDFQ